MIGHFDWQKALVTGAVAVALMASSTPLRAQEKLTVWWVKGFYQSEDDALYEAIRKFEQKTSVKVELSQYAGQDIIPKTVAALDASMPPDVAYGDTFDLQVTGKWAFDGKLEDISDVINPIKNLFAPNTVETTFLHNDQAKKKAYYAFPLRQMTLHIQHWADMLQTAGLKERDIPATWKDYWSFWCAKAQLAYRQKSGTRNFGVGLPMGLDSSDSFYVFLTMMDAYDVKLVDDNGKLLVDDPKVKQGLMGALKDYTDIYTKGCTPPSSTNWKDPDNNVAFNNRSVLMTLNATISVPMKWLDDANNTTLAADVREQAKKNYDEKIIVRPFPTKPDGKPMVYRASIKTGVVFRDAKNKSRGKEFVAFLLQEENLRGIIEASLGRWYPVTKVGQASPFWQNDKNRKTVYEQFTNGTVTFEFTKNYKFTILNNENVWAKAASRVVNEKVSVEKAVDEMIVRIKQVAG